LTLKTGGEKCFLKKTGKNLKRLTNNINIMLGNVLNDFNLETNFWDANPQLQVPFHHLLEKEGKEESSENMWSISLLIHPDSKLGNLPYEDRVEIIKSSFFPSFDETKYEQEIALFKELCMTRTERMLYAWQKKIDERVTFLDTLDYNGETFEMIDKMITTGDKLLKQLQTIKEELEKERQESSYVKGGGNLSLSDQGKI
jgi:hypothetical protein